MNTSATTLLLATVLIGGLVSSHAQLTIPSDGSDGVFAPTENVEIDLGLASTATWDTSGSGNGVYDPNQWAVVFKYSSVNIPTGVKVTFKNHPTYAPVVWLVQGNVVIDGELNLDGEDPATTAIERLTPGEPGPGGFRGAAQGPLGSGAGYGPGGRNGSSGRYAEAYGSPQVIPLVGGAGGGVDGTSSATWSGGGAGGAILIATGTFIKIDGILSANGGGDAAGSSVGARASGGAVRLITPSVNGSGEISAMNSLLNGSGQGRIRVETNSLSVDLRTFPNTIAVQPANPPIIWPAANAPIARVISVDAIPAPADPRAPVVAAADVAIQNSDPVNIQIETQNFPIEGIVQLFVIPKFGNRSSHNATRISGDINQAVWQVQTALPQGFVTLQARATQP